MAFSATDTAFEGFRIARERPLAILAWAMLQLVSAVITNGSLVYFAGPFMSTAGTPGTPPADPAAALAGLASLLPAYGVMLVSGIVIWGLINASVCRVVLRPKEAGLAGLKFGGDEVRQGVVAIILFALLIAIYITGAIAAALLMVVFSIGGHSAGLVGAAIGATALICGLIWLMVRLSFASSLTFDKGKVDVFGSWPLTGPVFWPLLGGYALAFVLSVVVGALIAVILIAVASVMGGGLSAFAQLIMHPNYGSLAVFFSPLMLLYMVFVSLITGLTTAIMSGACARAYSQLRAPPAEVF